MCIEFWETLVLVLVKNLSEVSEHGHATLKLHVSKLSSVGLLRANQKAYLNDGSALHLSCLVQ